MINFLKKLFGFPDKPATDKHRWETENTDDGRENTDDGRSEMPREDDHDDNAMEEG